jgi:hypothetical protein
VHYREDSETVQYIKVRWIHCHPDYPVLLYSELDNDRWECRKVELFADGKIGFASRNEAGASAGTRLGIEPVPTLDAIAAHSQFQPVEITKDEFEQVWVRTRAPAKGQLPTGY